MYEYSIIGLAGPSAHILREHYPDIYIYFFFQFLGKKVRFMVYLKEK